METEEDTENEREEEIGKMLCRVVFTLRDMAKIRTVVGMVSNTCTRSSRGKHPAMTNQNQAVLIDKKRFYHLKPFRRSRYMISVRFL